MGPSSTKPCGGKMPPHPSEAPLREALCSLLICSTRKMAKATSAHTQHVGIFSDWAEHVVELNWDFFSHLLLFLFFTQLHVLSGAFQHGSLHACSGLWLPEGRAVPQASPVDMPGSAPKR